MTSARTPTRLNSLLLRNYRCFPELEVRFHPALTVVVAPNGSGKTAILDAVAVALRLFVDTIQSRLGSLGFDHDDIRLQLGPDGTMNPALPTSFEADGSISECPLTWSRTLESDKPRAKTTFVDALSLKEAATTLRKHLQDFNDAKRTDSPVLPIFAYYGTGRLFGAHKLTKKKAKAGGGTNRLLGYEDCLSSASRYKYFQDWFERFSRVAQQEKTDGKSSPHAPREKLEAVTSAVNALLEPSGWQNLSWDFADNQIVATHPEHGTLPVDHLSDGIRNMIGMVGDIAHRCTRLNPQLGAQAARQTHGIVMVDEVDMHLHPEWQHVVIQSLRDAFPMIQLIVTTHSPQVVSTVKPESLRVLRRDAAGKWIADDNVPNTYGHSNSRSLEAVMGGRAYPEHLPAVAELREYQRLVGADQHDSPRALELRTNLEAVWGKHDPELQLADVGIRKNEALRKFRAQRK